MDIDWKYQWLGFPTAAAKARLLWPTLSCRYCGVLEFSGPNFIAGLIFGSIGFVAFVCGKRMNLWRTMFAGLALMIYPYFIANTVLLLVVGTIGSAAVLFLRE
jgi:hypothetical protein